MRRPRGAPHVLAAGLLLAYQLGGGSASPGLSSPTGAPPRRPSGPIDQIERSVTRPLPSVPAPAPTRPERIWVPDRHVPRADGNAVHVPGHWEYRHPTGEYQVPPLQGCTQDGRCETLPGGDTRLPPSQRQSP